MAFKGSLKDIALPDILQLISAQGMKGVLTLTRGPEHLRIQVIDGKAIGADTNLRPLAQRVATTLVNGGRLSRDDLRRALDVVKQRSDRLSKVLVDLEMVPADTIRNGYTVHYQQMIYDVLRWEDGNYDFERRDVTADEDVEPIGFQGLLMSGMQMIDEWPMVETRISNREAIVHRATPATAAPVTDSPFDAVESSPAAAPEPELSEVETQVLAQVDGASTIQVIIDRTMRLEFEVCKALYDLMEHGLVTMAFEGSLTELGLPELVHAMRCTASTGQLELRTDDVKLSVWFQQGDIVDACSSDPDESLGPYLLQSGTIGRADLEAALGATTTTEVGPWLAQRGRLTPDVMNSARLELITHLIATRFPERRGGYRFIPGNTSPSASDDLAKLTPGIVMSGIRAISRWSRLAAAVGDPSTVYRYDPSRRSPTWSDEVSSEHQRLLDLFADGCPVEGASEKANVTDYLLHQVVWWGHSLGLLDGPPTSAASQLLVAALSGDQQVSSSTGIDDLFESVQPARPAAPVSAAPPPTPVAAKVEPQAADADFADFADMLRPTEPSAPAPPAPDALDLDVDALADLADLAPDELKQEPPPVRKGQPPPPRKPPVS